MAPRALRRRSLAYARQDMAGAVTPSGFFVAPRRQPRGPSALARLGMTSRDAVPNEVKGLYGNSDSF
jgi:hypothetical protein